MPNKQNYPVNPKQPSPSVKEWPGKVLPGNTPLPGKGS